MDRDRGIEIARRALRTFNWHVQSQAEAVVDALIAAGWPNRECPECAGSGDRVIYDESGYGNPPEREACPRCGGSGLEDG